MEKETYLVRHKKCRIEVGDKVKVKRKAKDFESGWNNSWLKEMDKAVGKIGGVIRDLGGCGFTLSFLDKSGIIDFSFPYFVLEKVKGNVKQKEVEIMKTKVFWMSRDKDKECEVLFWAKKPELNEDGQWYGKGKNTEPDCLLSSKEVARVFEVKVKVGEIKACRIVLVDET